MLRSSSRVTVEIWMTRRVTLRLRHGAEAVALLGDGASPNAMPCASAGRTTVYSSRPIAACSAPPTSATEKTPVSTEPASQRRLTRRRSGGPFERLRV